MYLHDSEYAVEALRDGFYKSLVFGSQNEPLQALLRIYISFYGFVRTENLYADTSNFDMQKIFKTQENSQQSASMPDTCKLQKHKNSVLFHGSQMRLMTKLCET